jgi:hypothetical protein
MLPLGITAAPPAFWYVLAALAILTPLYFLFTRPRKRKRSASWKG